MNLVSTSDIVRIITTTTANISVDAAWVDNTTTAMTPGATPTLISSATTTTVVAAPASSTQRAVTSMKVWNTHASTLNNVCIERYNGSTASRIWKGDLAAGEGVIYDGKSVIPLSALGVPKVVQSASAPASNTINIVVLGSDVVNNNAVANTIADVTGLSFSVTAGQTYWYEFIIPYTSAATTTGSRWAISGPSAPTMLNHRSEYTLTATTQTTNTATAYDIPAASNASSLTTGNVATMWGIITPSASGTVIARFASEITSSAITAKAGATLRWIRVL